MAQDVSLVVVDIYKDRQSLHIDGDRHRDILEVEHIFTLLQLLIYVYANSPGKSHTPPTEFFKTF